MQKTRRHLYLSTPSSDPDQDPFYHFDASQGIQKGKKWYGTYDETPTRKF